jgi:hypothetical protein
VLSGMWNWITIIACPCLILTTGLARRRQRKLGFLSCPGCGQQIPQQNWGRFITRFLSLRKAEPCPNCGLALQWARWPYRVAVGANIVWVAVLLVEVIYQWWNGPWQTWRVNLDGPFFNSALICLFVSMAAEYFQRFEHANGQASP